MYMSFTVGISPFDKISRLSILFISLSTPIPDPNASKATSPMQLAPEELIYFHLSGEKETEKSSNFLLSDLFKK